MGEDQRNARIFGVLFIITFLTSIPAVISFQALLDVSAGPIAGCGIATSTLLGGFLAILSLLAITGTGVRSLPAARGL